MLNKNTLALKIWALQIIPKTQNGFYIVGIFRKVIWHAVRSQT